MNGRDIYLALGGVDEALVAEAAEPPRRRRRPLGRVLLAAACVCVLLGATALAAETLWGVGVTDIFVGKEESGYRVLGAVQPVPEEAFSPGMDEVLQEIRRQWADYQPYESWYPGHWRTDMDT